MAEAEAAFFAKYAAAPPPLIHKIKPECPQDIADAFCISFEASYYALKYYNKWLYRYHQRRRYFIYEKKLLKLFYDHG